ncbi:NnrU family protein [Kiloniella laminariae]|uniref:NnrU family protein n=1 Tax=Kiloniella laminariae TaxID=454162 RepID=A0ABT4LGW2_9PROT|nr:NnrU family protein [Kiloniella laminariae]MCZ4280339.1 NnrU family protein [Kiloniella laminariae]
MFGGFGELVAAFAIFLCLHSIPPMRPVKQRLISLFGKRGYYLGYSLLSLLVIVWLLQTVWSAPYVELWPYEFWAARATAYLMLPASVLFFAGFLRPNPVSIGPAGGYRADRAGFVGIVRHPALWGFALWSGAHLLVNGDLAAVMFFGGLLLLSLGGMFIVDRRKKKLLGETAWRTLTENTSNLPFWGLFKGGNCRFVWMDVWAVITGSGFYLLVIWLHPFVVGVSPLSGFFE